jgi:hypothetical protein
MANNSDDDLVGVLIGLGVLAVVGVGVLTVIKAIAGYKLGETISEAKAVELASTYAPRSYEPSPNCYIHGDDAELCDSCNKCIECRGEGDLYTARHPLCSSCGYYDSGDDD